jgi:hypothetical protein
VRAVRQAGAARLLRSGAAALLLALAATGCGSASRASEEGLRLQREDLIASARALEQAAGAVRAETAATKAAWPLVANGLPSAPRPEETARIAAAARAAGELKPPALFGELRSAELTGPAASIAGTFRNFAGLAYRGWQMIGYAVSPGGSGTAAAFAHANAPLYIESVYDAHFGLAQVGKKLLAGWEKLGGSAAFGSSLPRGEVERLAGAYSERELRLHPHDGVRLGS